MKTLSVAAILTVLLAACGGGGSTGQPVSTRAPTPPPAGVISQPGSKDQVVEAPAPPVTALKMSVGGNFTQGGSAQNAIVSFTGAANLTLSGRLDGIWLSASRSGGSVVVSGDLNTVVFMPGVDTTVTVTGSANTFYLPLDSTIKLEGSGLASSTVRYYKS
ncbi:hypothetical protein [Massilia aerilata]|uniref:DUF3060 domain-containing protein n=1 Tax=Massilia aerilata TaxID=453817 RepID=A0ABW0S6D0_9BURK